MLLWVFLATALIGVWAAWDPNAAWAKFYLIVGAIGLYYAIAHQPDLDHVFTILVFFGIFGVGLALYFFVTNDWSAQTTKIAFLASIGKGLAALLPSLAAHQLHPNVAGGMLGLVLPVYVPLFILSRKRRSKRSHSTRWRWITWLWIVAAWIVLLAELVSESRGAWLGIAITGVMWLAWRFLGWLLHARPIERMWRLRVLIMGAVWLIGAAAAIAVISCLLNRDSSGLGTLSSRVGLLRDGLLLARDYPLTGAGLGMFQLQHSTYILLIHVPYIIHTHDLLVNILIEQGLFGLLAYLGLAAVSISTALRSLRYATSELALIIEASFAMLLVIWLHGWVDDTLYGSRGLLLLWAPLAMIGVCYRLQSQALPESQPSTRRWLKPALGVALAALVILSIVWGRPVVASAFSNLGSVEQSRVELSHYDPDRFDKPSLDRIRQTQNLDRSIGLFEHALSIDPANLTAHQRLTGIDLSRGQYSAALDQIQLAWMAGYHDAVTRLLLGDAYVANGQVAQGVEAVKDLPEAIRRLEFQAFYRYTAAKDYRRAADAWAAVVALDPGNQAAIKAQADAARRVVQP
ncbi:MAG TPA: O-antigen ligase family protein [Anaerolineae bacterium]|nr:O-antigen ligase family protein [Anaerolineae bacterium]